MSVCHLVLQHGFPHFFFLDMVQLISIKIAYSMNVSNYRLSLTFAVYDVL